MNIDELAAGAVKQIEDADLEAEQAQLALVLGDFQPYFERKVAAARSRLEDRYRELNERTNTAAKSVQPTGGGSADLSFATSGSHRGLPIEPGSASPPDSRRE